MNTYEFEARWSFPGTSRSNRLPIYEKADSELEAFAKATVSASKFLVEKTEEVKVVLILRSISFKARHD